MLLLLIKKEKQNAITVVYVLFGNANDHAHQRLKDEKQNSPNLSTKWIFMICFIEVSNVIIVTVSVVEEETVTCCEFGLRNVGEICHLCWCTFDAIINRR